MDMKTLIFGGHGVLGSKLQKHFPDAICPPNCKHDGTFDPDCCDITDDWEVGETIWQNKPEVVINCAAMKTTQCDEYKVRAMMTNIVGTANIAVMCDRIGAKLVYISTDYVFKGDRGDYAPNDEVLPQNYYAETKLAGEYCAKAVKNHLIIRLSFFPDEYPYDGAFTDQWTTKIPVTEAAERIAKLVGEDARGIHHIAGPKRTVYDYAVAHSRKPIKRMKLADQEFKRPRDTSLVE